MNTAASSDEKIMAALAHGSIVLMFMGPIVPVILWASQRKKSNYVSFHALQAMGYQAFTFWLWILVILLATLLPIFLIPLTGFFADGSTDAATFPLLFQLPIFLVIFGFMGAFFILGLGGAVICLLGRDFRYPLLGKWLERYLSDEAQQIVELKEDNWVAGVCHATAVLQLWGVATPLLVWFTQKERSARLRFQSMQAFMYQLVALLAYMLGMAVYMVVFLGMFVTLAVGSSLTGASDVQGTWAVLMILFVGIMLLVWLVILIAMPVYYFLAALGSLRAIQGRPFRYPILGKVLERQMGTSALPEVAS